MVKQELRTSRRHGTTSSVAILAIAPLVLLGAFVYHPFIARLTDPAAVAEAMAADTFRWGVAHLAGAVGAGLLLAAFIVVRDILADAGENSWSAVGLPFVAVATVLFAVLPGMELGVMSAVDGLGAGAQAAAAAQAAVDPWFIPMFVGSSVLLLIGAVAFAGAIIRSEILSPGLTRLVTWSLAIMALARFAPLSAALWISGLAAVLALWPLAYQLRRSHA